MPTCLVVEDHAQLRQMLCEWLQISFPEVAFIGAESGEAALELAERLDPEALLVDLHLPGIGGIEVTRRVKRRRPQAFVVIHTIHDDPAFRSDAAAAGADAFVPKNRTASELFAVLSGFYAGKSRATIL